jgi:hypothetical protein
VYLGVGGNFSRHLAMKIKDKKKFFLGLVLTILSYIPFSYMNHAENLKLRTVI